MGELITFRTVKFHTFFYFTKYGCWCMRNGLLHWEGCSSNQSLAHRARHTI